MKLSERTLALLKSFTGINPSIVLFEGSELKTQTPQKNMFVKAQIKDTFPVDASFLDLSRFLNTLSLFDDPDVDFGPKFAIIKDARRTVKYLYAATAMLKGIPDKTKSLYLEDFKNPLATIKVGAKDLQSVVKALGVLGVDDIVFKGEDGKVVIAATNMKNPTSDRYELAVGETDKAFSVVFNSAIFKLIPGDYEITLFGNLGYFKSEEVEYFITCST